MTSHIPNIAVYADVQNLYYTTRDAYGQSLNYRAVMQRIHAQGNIVCATVYAIERDDKKQRQFQDALRHTKFDVKLKPYIQHSDGSAKGDWDVGITIDVMSVPNEVDTVVLLSGDVVLSRKTFHQGRPPCAAIMAVGGTLQDNPDVYSAL